MAGAEAAERTLAATWRREDDQVVATTFGGTMCWDPVRPGRLRVESDGFVHVARCRKCPGCREFERRRLGDRLTERYMMQRPATSCTAADRRVRIRNIAETTPPPLFLVRVWLPQEQHASFAHALHRRPSLELEPGFFRLGSSSLGLLSRSKRAISRVLHAREVRWRIEPIRLRRGRRAWRSITAGLLVAREAYGENVNRFYARGLPPALKQQWDVIKLKTRERYDRRSSPRAWTVDRLVLVPPELWKLGRGDRKNIMRMIAREHSPEGVASVVALVGNLAANFGRPLPVTAPPQAALTRQQVLEYYQRMREKKAAARTENSEVSSDPPSSEKGGYTSSEHSSGSGPPVEQWLKSDRERKARLADRGKQWLDDWAKRMAEKAKERGRG